jgi:RNA polymerase sigma-70 factor (ECF subfamily)
VAYAVAVLAPGVTGWAPHWLLRRPVECGSGDATAERRLAVGARVNEGTIRVQVERARAGDDEALGELFQRLRPDLVRFCARMLGSVDAEDCANEVFLRAQRRLESYDPAQPFRRWLLAIAAHHCIDSLRRRSLEKRLFEAGESDIEDLAGNASSALDGLVRAQGAAVVQAAIDRLADRYRAPLVLRYFAELSYDEIGVELDLTRSQVATLLFRGKRRLRDLLRVEEETEA